MTCNDKCIHYPVCEQKNFDFANIEDCPHYLDLSKEIRTIKVPTYPDVEDYCIRCIPADVLNEYMSGAADCMDEDAKQASIPYTYNAPQHDWKCGYPTNVSGETIVRYNEKWLAAQNRYKSEQPDPDEWKCNGAL